MARRKKIRFGVIGLGNIAQVAVLPAFAHAKGAAELTALVSNDPVKLAELSARHQVEHTASYEGFDELARRGVMDAVYIALPNHLHREWTERAAGHGLHVLCEKPMALTVADCEAMIETTRRQGVLLMIAYRLHFEKTNLRAIELVQAGEIGEPRFFSSVFGHTVRAGDIRRREETGGGALYDLGVYCINAARYLFRAEPTEVFCRTIGAPVDDAATALMRFSGDRLAQFTVGQSIASVSSYRVLGTAGDIVLEPAYDYTEPLRLAITKEGKTRRMRTSKGDQFAPELIYLARCINENREPEPSGAEGIEDVRVVEAALESARSGLPVELPGSWRERRPEPGQEMHKPPVREAETVHALSPSVD